MLKTMSYPADLRSKSDQGTMKCKRCQSQSRKEFSGELAIHFTGLAGLNKPIVWVFPELLACLDCGFTEFIVPEKELKVLETGTTVEGSLVWLGSSQE